MIHYRSDQGQLLVEAVVVVGMLLLFVTGILTLSTKSMRDNRDAAARSTAVKLSQSAIEYIRFLRDHDYPTLIHMLGTVNGDTSVWCLDDALLWKAADTLCPFDIHTVYGRTVTFKNRESLIGVEVKVSWKDGSLTKYTNDVTEFAKP